MKLKVLGTVSPHGDLKHNCPGFLIMDNQNKIMLDCGSGTHKLLNIPHDLQNLSVIISHLHRDHYSDIYNLQYSSFVYHNLKRIEKPIDIYLPETPNRNYEDIIYESTSFAKHKKINENETIKIGNLNVSFIKTVHPLETYAIKVTNGDSTIVYSSDASFSGKDKLVEFSKNADLLICESSLLKSYGFPEINSHLTAEQAATIARNANVKGLMLTHFWPEEPVQNFINEAKKVFEKVIPAVEGQIIDFPRIQDKNKNMR